MSELFIEGDSVFVCVDRHVPVKVGTMIESNSVKWNDYAKEHGDIIQWSSILQKKIFENGINSM